MRLICVFSLVILSGCVWLGDPSPPARMDKDSQTGAYFALRGMENNRGVNLGCVELEYWSSNNGKLASETIWKITTDQKIKFTDVVIKIFADIPGFRTEINKAANLPSGNGNYSIRFYDNNNKEIYVGYPYSLSDEEVHLWANIHNGLVKPEGKGPGTPSQTGNTPKP